jgi:hypothetical protein
MVAPYGGSYISMGTRVAVLVTLVLALLPAAASAESDAMMTRIERTPAYVLSLAIGPVESMDMAHPAMGDSNMMSHPATGDTAMMSTPMADQGMAVNHRLDVRIMRADSGATVDDVTPTIRITDKATGESRDLPQVVGMAGMSSDFHYGQNVWLPDGTYQVTVFVNPTDTALFRDVMVIDHSMGMGMGMHDMGPQPPTTP